MGACIASFLNVVVWRVPRGESIVSPPSHCPKCGAPIRWWQNIPVVSWLALRGKCAKCRAGISPRYILVELLGGLLFLAAFWRYGMYAPAMWVWIALMIAGSFIDIDHQLLPDFVTVGGMIYGVALSLLHWAGELLAAPAALSSPLYIRPVESIGGMAFGFGLMWLVRFLGTKAFRREAMGMGDVFLMGAIGAIFGFRAVLASLILSAFAGSFAGLAMIALAKTRPGAFTAIPYGPYICLGCLAWMFRGEEMWRWYVALLTGK